MAKRKSRRNTCDENALKDFKKLFRAARSEHSKNMRSASTRSPKHLEAIAFARSKGIPGAEELLSALPAVWNRRKMMEALATANAAATLLPAELVGYGLEVRGLLNEKLKRWDEAIQLYREALGELGDEMPGVVYNNLGNALNGKGQNDLAIECYQKALDSPGYDSGIANHNMGLVYSENGEYGRAIECYEMALRTKRYDTPHLTLTSLANTLRQMGRYQEALECVSKVLAEEDNEGEHSRARHIKKLIEESRAGLKPTIAEESLARDGNQTLIEAPEKEMLNKLGRQEQGRKDQYDQYLTREIPLRHDGFFCLRGWSSAVTLLEGGEDCHWTGGGYFLRWKGKGIVLDPGFDFLDNFHDAELHLKEVDAVLVSHNHSDHNYDLNSLDDLRYELHRRWKLLSPEERKKHDVSRCLFVVDEDTAKAFRGDDAEHRRLPMKFDEAHAQRQLWLNRPNELPFTIEHFKV